MKRLFQLSLFGNKKMIATDDNGNGLYFEKKSEAKEVRDEWAKDSKGQVNVTYGPDHRLFSKGFIPGRFKGKHGGKVTSGIAKNKRLTHPDRADRMRQRNLRPAAAA